MGLLAFLAIISILIVLVGAFVKGRSIKKKSKHKKLEMDYFKRMSRM